MRMARASRDWIPLREWRVGNFKSVPTAALELRPLTLLVGPNSSGKSTIIQSILLAVQAARGGVEGASLPLNGPLVSLGGYVDVKSRLSETPTISLGGDFQFTEFPGPRRSASRLREHRSPRPYRWTKAPFITGFVRWVVTLDQPSVEEPGAADIASVSMRVESEEPVASYLDLEARRRGAGEIGEDEERIRLARLTWPTRQDFVLGYAGVLKAPDGIFGGGVPPDEAAVHGLALRAGIPHNVVVEWPFSALAARVWVETRTQRPLWRGVLGPSAPAELSDAGEPLSAAEEAALGRWSDQAVSEIEEWKRKHGRGPTSLPIFLSRHGEQIEATERTILRARSRVLVEAIQSKLQDEARVYAPPEFAVASALDQSAMELHSFLSERVIHLGPLREDPRVTYRITPLGVSGDIGPKGEYAASVLHARRATIVPCPLKDGRVEQMPLVDALNYWVSELQLADAVTTRDLDRLGIQVSVSRGGVGDLDLTSVGVGVSQLLPVILVCISAPLGSLVLLEQPELHLHPAVQQKLAEFLLACSMGGRQLLVETHSEYLVSRLRLRIAEGEGRDLSNQITVIYVEQHDGQSKFRRIQMNELGGIEDWPAGFFDQSADESKRIVEAGLKKKLRSVRDGPGR